jgi:hypothetical protein
MVQLEGRIFQTFVMRQTDSRKFLVTIRGRTERVSAPVSPDQGWERGPQRPVGTFAARVLGGLSAGWKPTPMGAWRVDPAYMRAYRKDDRLNLLRIQGFLRWLFNAQGSDNSHSERAATRAATEIMTNNWRKEIFLVLPMRDGVGFRTSFVGAVWVSASFGAGNGCLRACHKCERLFLVKRPENRTGQCKACSQPSEQYAAGFSRWVQLEWERSQGRERKRQRTLADYRAWRDRAFAALEQCLRGTKTKAAQRAAVEAWLAAHSPRHPSRGRPRLRSAPTGAR